MTECEGGEIFISLFPAVFKMAEWEERTSQSSPLRSWREVTYNGAATPDHLTLTVVLITLASPLNGGRSLPANLGSLGCFSSAFHPERPSLPLILASTLTNHPSSC